MKNKILITFFLGLFLISFSLAEESGGELIGKQNDCITLPQECADCTFINLTSIQYPNMTRTYINSLMTKQGSSFNYSFCDTEDLGDYVYCFIGDVGGTNTVACKDFQITYSGENLNVSQTYIYIIALIFLVLLIGGSFILMNKLPSSNAKDEQGSIIQISQLKHFRKVFWGFIWGLSLAIIFILSNISYAYLPNAMIGNFFFAIYRIMFWFTIIFVPLGFIWLLYSMYKDNEFQKMINRGVEVGDL